MDASEVAQVVVALAIENPSSVHDVARLMRAEDIADRALADAWTAYRVSVESGKRWDAEALAMALRSRGAPEAAHAVEAAYATFRRSRVRSDSVEVLAREVGESARLRRLRDALVDALEITRNVGAERTTEEAIREAVARIDSATEEHARGRAVPIRQFAESELERMVSFELGTHDPSMQLGVPIGFGPLDEHLSGVRPGELVLVAGSTGSGKTSFATGAAVACARAGQRALVLTYEMVGDEYMRRIASYESGTSEHHVGPGRMHTLPSRAYVDAVRQYASPSDSLGGLIGVDDRPATIDEIETLVRAEVRRAPLALVIVDHVGLVRRSSNRTSEYDAITQAIVRLKLLANETRTSIVVLAQLNREVSRRDDPRPRLSDLRSSGELEQSANFVVFPYRPIYAAKQRGDHPADLPEVENATIILAKARRRGLAEWPALFTGSACRFDPYVVVEEAGDGTFTDR